MVNRPRAKWEVIVKSATRNLLDVSNRRTMARRMDGNNWGANGPDKDLGAIGGRIRRKGSTYVFSENTESDLDDELLYSFGIKIIRRIFGVPHYKGIWRKIYDIVYQYKEIAKGRTLLAAVKFDRLGLGI